MDKWVRAKQIPDMYAVGKSYVYELIKEFMAETDPENFIKDGRVIIVKQKAFEEWWRYRRRDDE